MDNNVKNKNLMNAIKEYEKYYENTHIDEKGFGMFIDSVKIREDCIYINGLKVENVESNGKIIELTELKNRCSGEISVLGVDMSDSELDFLKLCEYEKIELSYVNIVDISDLKITLSSTENINLSHNKIRDISAFSEKQYDMRYIKVLDLSFNRIKDISALNEYIWLERLDVSSNKIEDISALEKLRTLEILNLSKNNIKSIKPLTNLRHLKQLDLRDNKIEDIEEILFIRNLLNIKLDKESLPNIKVSKDIIEKEIIRLQKKIRDVNLKEEWNLLDGVQRKDKEKELKEKVQKLHPLSNFDVYVVAENLSNDEDYVLCIINLKYFIIVNLRVHEYIPSEFQIGYVAFKSVEEMIDFIKDANYVV